MRKGGVLSSDVLPTVSISYTVQQGIPVYVDAVEADI
jgi:hypothetical protein